MKLEELFDLAYRPLSVEENLNFALQRRLQIYRNLVDNKTINSLRLIGKSPQKLPEQMLFISLMNDLPSLNFAGMHNLIYRIIKQPKKFLFLES